MLKHILLLSLFAMATLVFACSDGDTNKDATQNNTNNQENNTDTQNNNTDTQPHETCNAIDYSILINAQNGYNFQNGEEPNRIQMIDSLSDWEAFKDSEEYNILVFGYSDQNIETLDQQLNDIDFNSQTLLFARSYSGSGSFHLEITKACDDIIEMSTYTCDEGGNSAIYTNVLLLSIPKADYEVTFVPFNKAFCE